MANSKYIIILATFLTVTLCANAQNGVNTPYSRYGWGVLSDRSMGFNKGMSGVAQGFRDGQIVNVSNPASYSAVDTLTALFDLGITLSNSNYKMNGLQQNIRNTSFDYAATHFRLLKGLGMAFGVLPVSNIKYSFSSTSEKLDGTEDISSSYSFSGDGGLRQAFLGVGWQVFKPLSIGANIAYLWGDYTHNMTLGFNNTSIYSNNRIYTADISTYSAEFGIQYTQPLTKKDKITLGATYGLGHDVNSSAYRITSTTLNASGSSVVQAIDTVRVGNAFQLPHTFAAGITYSHADKLKIGVDVELQKWSKTRFPNNESTISSSSYTASTNMLYDREKITVGASYTPNMLSGKLFTRSTYKIGGYYARNYAKADMTGQVTTRPTEYGVSAGISLPLVNNNLWNDTPQINVSFQYAHTNIPYLSSATGTEQMLKEDYLRMSIGFTISERWFHKWKVK